jgi:type I restriction enzyme S subunit
LKYVNLKDYIDVIESGKREKGGALSDGIPSLGAEHLNSNGGFILNSQKLKYISKDYFDSLKSGIIKKNDILIVKDGATTGKVSYVNDNFPFEKSAINEHIFIIRPKKELLDKYLFYFLYSPIGNNKILEKFHGATVGGISKNFIDMSIPLPPLEEQRHISEVLDKVTAQIDTCNKLIDNLDLLVKSKFVEMFGTLHNNQNEYDIVKIEDVCSLIKDGTHQTPTYTENTGYKFLSSKDVMTQKIDWSNIKYIPADLHEKLYVTIKPQRNDILMSKNGVNYGVAAVNDTDEVFDIYVSLALLRPLKTINPIYFRCVINNVDTKKQFDKSIKGIGVPNLHLGEIKKTRILLPPIELQNQFADFVESVEHQKTTALATLNRLETLKNALMQQYFNGNSM